MLTYINAFNLFKINFLAKKRVMFLPNKKKNLIVLKLFLQANLVLGYANHNENTLKVFLTGMASPYRLKNFYKPTKFRCIKIKDIHKYKNKNTGSTYILSTPQGIITLKEAVKANVGGILLFKMQ